MAIVWTVVLVTSIFSIVGFARAGSIVFWKGAAIPASGVRQPSLPALPVAAAGALVAGMIALAVFAGPVTSYLDATAAGLIDPTAYIHAVLGPDAVAARWAATASVRVRRPPCC